MRRWSAWLILLAALPARAQTRVAAPVEAGLLSLPSGAAATAPSSLAASPLAPALAFPLLAAPPVAAPLAAAPAPLAAAPAPLPARVAALSAGVTRAAAALSGGKSLPAASAYDAGRKLEEVLTGAASPAEDAAPATAAELDFAAGAGTDLGRRADDLGAARGLKAASMSGADFAALVEDAARAADAESAAPTPAAAGAARAVRAALVRVVRALVPADKPLKESVARALSVWQVFDQEMAVAAGRGTLAAVSADAALFASQVEESVAPPPAPRAALAPAEHPEDPEGYATISVPGSVFGWKPVEESPGHGFPPADALIRRVLSERRGPARSAGFELAGAPRREDARVYFYGERHTDGGLIAANMKRLVEDARPGGAMIVLVEGYTGWALRGYAAVKYLADRGLDPEALAAKGIGGESVEVRGWDTVDGYQASKHPLLQHHMNLLALNQLAAGPERGPAYYLHFARAAWTALLSWRDLWRAAIVARNADLDRAVARAVADADATGATVHAIAGSDHLVRTPRRDALFPRLSRPALRPSLAAALGGRPFWASRPPETPAP